MIMTGLLVSQDIAMRIIMCTYPSIDDKCKCAANKVLFVTKKLTVHIFSQQEDNDSREYCTTHFG